MLRLVGTRRTRAFTLVELLLVIGVIALLMAIITPTLARAKERARTTTCASNLRQIGISYINYVTDRNDGRNLKQATGEAGTFWMYVSQEYHSNDNKVYFCPKANLPVPSSTFLNADNPAQAYWGNIDYGWDGTTNTGRWIKYAQPNKYVTPTTGTNSQGLVGITTAGVDIDLNSGNSNKVVGYKSSYGINNWIDAYRYRPNTNYGAVGDMRRLPDTLSPSSTPMFVDCAWAETDGSNSTASTALIAAPAGTTNTGMYPGVYPSNGPNGNYDLRGSYTNCSTGRVLLNRHGMSICSVYVDGSATELKLADIWKVTWFNGWVPQNINLPPQ